jgi:GH15 family glucan-1,4-alpha-glucosidase
VKIEDYALIGNLRTAALIALDGSMDWLCVPRFDAGACFAALLGTPDHGRWLLRPADESARVERKYLQDTLILETRYQTSSGSVRVLDYMPIAELPVVTRIVEGVSGCVSLRSELVIRFDYGHIVPWVRSREGRWTAVAGPDALDLETAIPLRGEGLTSVAEFEVHEGERIPFSLRWFPSHEQSPPTQDARSTLAQTETFWRDWAGRSTDDGPHRDDIVRSLITLKALTYAPTGGIIAAPTTSLPEVIGGSRNWDYRYCWLRDSTFTLYALLHGGYADEAAAFHDWLLRAVAGDPGKVQICYGLAGERRLQETELPWLPGYEASQPVRIGNAASLQLQLDVYGEVSDTLHQARRCGIDSDEPSWAFQRAHTEWLEQAWSEPDQGLWEMRGPPQQFTHSKVLAWVALDRAVKAIEQHGFEGPLERWRSVRADIHASVCERAFSTKKNSFTQAYDSDALDASLLLIPAVGFLGGDDERVLGTIRAVERELLQDGLVRRYVTAERTSADGLAGQEGVFLACSFWLVDAYVLTGQPEKGQALFDRLLTLKNDVGLLAEEYEPAQKRLLGNFPQAYSHVALINSARNLTQTRSPGQHRKST